MLRTCKCQSAGRISFAGFPDKYFVGKKILELGCGLGVVGQVHNVAPQRTLAQYNSTAVVPYASHYCNLKLDSPLAFPGTAFIWSRGSPHRQTSADAAPASECGGQFWKVFPALWPRASGVQHPCFSGFTWSDQMSGGVLNCVRY